MDMYGGYYMVSLSGADLAETDPVYIQGAYQAVYKGIHTDKPILIYHVVYGDIKMSPMYGILSKENNVLYLKTLYALIEITSADQVVVIPTPSIDDVEAEIELIRIELENLTGQISDITDSIDDMESEIYSVQGDITDLQADLSTVSGKADQALSAAQQAARDLDDLTDVVADLSGDVVDLTRDLTALTGTVTTLSGTVSNLSGTVNTLSSAVSTLGSDVSDLTDDLADEIAYTHGSGLFTALLGFFYPIGSYYETSDTTFDPNVEWGGTWVLETEGQVHVSAGSNYPVNGAATDTNDGGSKDAIVPYHRHDIAAHSTESSGSVDTGNMSANASHHHTFSYAQYNRGTGSATTSALQYSGSTKTTDDTSVQHKHTVPDHTHSIAAQYTKYAGTNGNVTDANMQPYIIVNRWHRTA